MKKSLVLTSALVAALFGALLLAGCENPAQDDDDGGGGGGEKTGSLRVINESSVILLDINWGGKSLSGEGEYEFEPGAISAKTTVDEETAAYVRFVKKYYDMSSEDWATMGCRTQEVITVSPGDTVEFRFVNSTIVVDENDSSNYGTLESIKAQFSGLTVKNNSSYDLQQVFWKGSSAAPIAQIAKNSEGNFRGEGSGYLYCTRRSPVVNLRTIVPVTVQKSEKGGSVLYTVTDDTEFIEVGSATNEGALKNIQKKVVFFDDFENEEIKADYASTSGVYSYDVMIGDDVTYYYSPKNGSRSLAVGGYNGTAQLGLNGIVLESAAKLSFYYANKHNTYNYDEDKNAAFYVNDVEKFTLKSTDSNWTRAEYSLEPGTYNFVWKKTDGVYYEGSLVSFFLSLDDILIEYE